MLTLTDAAKRSLNKSVKEPNIVLEIEGVGYVFGASIVKKKVRVGDPGLVIGDPALDSNGFYIGGLIDKADQKNKVSINATTNSIRQTLDIDKAKGGSISTISVALLDQDGSITKLITPGNQIADILQAKAKVYLGFSDLAFPEDYSVIFRGVVTDVTSDGAKVILQINHPDDKKLGSIYKQVQTSLNNPINNAQTAGIVLTNVDDMLLPITGPDGTVDPSVQCCILIDKEVISYTGIAGTTLTGVKRHQATTFASAHDAGTDVTTFYHMTGNCIDLALKIMLSGWNGPYLEDVPATSFVDVNGVAIANTVFFRNVDIVQKYNIYVGDFVTITGATNVGNNVTLRKIDDIIATNNGSYLLLAGDPLTSELTTAAVVAFRSQYDTMPDGLGLTNDEVDIDEHIRLFYLFLATFNYDFYIKDTITNARDFLEQEIYSPVAAFSLPRKSRASVGYHIGPIPGTDIKTFDKTNIKKPDQVQVKRTTTRQFYNEIVYKFDESPTEDTFLSGIITIAEDSKAQIKNYNKPLTIVSKGLKTATGGAAIVQSQSQRRLKRYKFAAEVFTFGTLFGDGFGVEIGDIIIFDGTDMFLPDIKTGLKGVAPRFLEVTNKDMNFITGDIKFECIDTNFNGKRYGLISPSSLVGAGISTTKFTIKKSFSGKFGVAEYKKWINLVGFSVRIRTTDFVTTGNTKIVEASTNTIKVSPALAFTPTPDMIMELTHYDNVNTTQKAKDFYAFMSDTDFADGTHQYLLL